MHLPVRAESHVDHRNANSIFVVGITLTIHALSSRFKVVKDTPENNDNIVVLLLSRQFVIHAF